MAGRQARRSHAVVAPLVAVATCLAAAASFWSPAPNAGAFSAAGRGVGRTALRAAANYESGKVNLGVEAKESDVVPQLPSPVLECNEQCITAIYECVEEGCSVEAMTKLDAKLADDEKSIVESISELKVKQKTEYCAENAGVIAWLESFLGRSSSLRAQLRAMKTITDSDFVQQLIRAAAVSFGGGRKDDYPKVGVSPFTE